MKENYPSNSQLTMFTKEVILEELLCCDSLLKVWLQTQGSNL